MSTSGIGVSQQLSESFAAAVEDKSIRFVRISIQNESLVHDLSIPSSSSLSDDLQRQTDENLLHLEDDIPVYILARLDEPNANEWLAISYVPDTAKVRDKMLYASTRGSLTRSLGSSLFADSLFATSKADLTPESYLAHKHHMAAPKPLSAREQEMADIRAAERDAGAGGGGYEGSGARQNLLGTGVGLAWTPEVEEAVGELGRGEGSGLVVIEIDAASETLVLKSTEDIGIDQLGSSLPVSEPCYAFFAWPHTHTIPPRREIIFIYSCPASSPIKHRMIYSSGVSGVFAHVKTILPPATSASALANRKIETSDPGELGEAFFIAELGLSGNMEGGEGGSGAATPIDEEKKPFARPKGPGRRR